MLPLAKDNAISDSARQEAGAEAKKFPWDGENAPAVGREAHIGFLPVKFKSSVRSSH